MTCDEESQQRDDALASLVMLTETGQRSDRCCIVPPELPFPELILSRGSVLRQGVWLEFAVGFV